MKFTRKDLRALKELIETMESEGMSVDDLVDTVTDEELDEALMAGAKLVALVAATLHEALGAAT